MQFFKYQGTGNDFILIDNRSEQIRLDPNTIKTLCDRRFGIGADGLMLLHPHASLDFEMRYFNADGHPGSLCGNGSRCLIQFAYDLGIRQSTYRFLASDGEHTAQILDNGLISLHMNDVSQIQTIGERLYLNTGSPHLIQFVNDLDALDVFALGKTLRYDPRFAPGGTNVNFLGVTACALALAVSDNASRETRILTPGGELEVRYETTDFKHFENIWLTGPAQKVFKGEI